MGLKAHKELHDVRTMTELVSDAEKPQRKYIKLAILELERVRRGKEKHRATQHLKAVDRRLAEIESEQSELLGEVQTVNQGHGRSAVGAPHGAKRPSRGGGDFTVTY